MAHLQTPFTSTTAVRFRSTIKMPGCKWWQKLKNPSAHGARGKNQGSTSAIIQATPSAGGRWLIKFQGTLNLLN
jgi:hypothetical protein